MINKYLFIAAIFCIPFLIGNSFSQSGPIYSADSDPIGKITNDGDILGSNGILIATAPDPQVGALMLLHVINLH